MNMNNLWARLSCWAALSLLCTAPLLAYADTSTNISTAPGVQISLHGFIDTGFFWQDQNFVFGNGQNAEWPVANTTGSKNNLSGFDIRNTRAWLDFTGPATDNGWKVSAHLEGDFFGGNNGTSAFSASQATPRLRQAFFTLKSPDGGSSVTLGQQWDLLFPIEEVPASFTHIAFPLGLGTGMIGWRFTGIVYSQELNQGAEAGTAKWRLDLGAFNGSWDGPGNNVNFGTAGNANFNPQIEARLHVDDGSWKSFITVHSSHESLAGVGGAAPTPIASSITSYAIEAGTIWSSGPWSVLGSVYNGKGLGQVFGAMAQFGDIKETGGYVQGGYKLDPHWGLYATYATVRPNQGDVNTWIGNGGLLKNQQTGLDLLYSNGPYGIGLEWMHAVLRSTTTGTNTVSTVGNQFSISGIYHF